MKWLVYMQVTEAQLDPTEGMWVEGSSDKLFGCKKTSDVEYFGVDTLKRGKRTIRELPRKLR